MRASQNCDRDQRLRWFELKGDQPAILVICALKLLAMPTDANACIFAVQYQRLVNPVSGAVALLAAAAKLPVVVVG
ncbi:hypothetical protein [Bradyrhizobium liaoningense]